MIVRLKTLILFSVLFSGMLLANAQPTNQIRQPDGDITTGVWTTPPLWSKINEGSQNPNGAFITCPNNANSTAEVSIGNPTYPGVYSEITVRARVCKSSSSGNTRGLDINLRVNNNLLGNKIMTLDMSHNFTMYTQTWSGYNFTREDLNSLQVLITSTGSIGGGNRRLVYVDLIELELNYTPVVNLYSLPFSENFNTSDNLPTDWIITDHQGSGQIWQIGRGGSMNGTVGNYAYLNSDAYGSGNSQNTDLISPIIDCSGFNSITLSFSHYFRQYIYSTASLAYSTNGGQSWSNIQQWTQTISNPTFFSIVVPELDNQSQVSIKWNYTGTWDWYWSVDDVTLTGTPAIYEVDFIADPLTTFTGETITFSDNSTGVITSWLWDFGAGAIPATATTPGPHDVIYSTSGSKTVSLTLNGTYTETKTNYIEVLDFYPPALFTNGKQITILASKVEGSGSHQDFPVLVSFTDPDLRHTLHGGKVQNPNGYDILFTLDDCSTTLDYQVEKYDGSTGEFIAWIRIPVLSNLQNTIIQMYYGKGNVSIDLSTANTWSSKYKARYHLNQNTPSEITTDYTANAHHSVSYEGNPQQVNGKIGSATQFSGSDAINLGTNILPGTKGTFSLWIRSNQPDNAYHGFIGSGAGGTTIRSPGLWIYSHTTIHGGYGNNSTWCSWINNPGSITNGAGANWHYIVYTYETGQPQQLFIDGVLNFTFTSNCNDLNPVATAIQFIGRRDNYFVGQIDEVSISAEVHDAGWIATEFNNQNDPSNFFIISGELSAGNLCKWVWTGNIDSDWNKPGNWSKPVLPDESSFVIIPISNNDPEIISSDVTIFDLEIQSGALLTTNSTSTLTVLNQLTNYSGESGLIIRSSSLGTGSLLHYSSNTPATFQRYISGEPEAWHLLSSAVSNQEISGEFTPTGGPGSYGDGTRYDFYTWFEPDTSWVYLLNTQNPPTWNEVHSSADFIPGKGYLVAYLDEHPTKNFAGILNSGPMNIAITKSVGLGNESGANLVGNPYPSSIDWKASSGWSRNDLEISNDGYDIWIWNDTAFNYGIFNSASVSDEGTLGVKRYIAPTQGFFIKSAVASGMLGMTDEVRVHDDAGNWLKSSKEVGDALHLVVKSSDGFGYDEVMLEFNQPKTATGSPKKFSFVKKAPSLFIPKNGQNYSLQLLGKNAEYPVIPIAFKAGENGAYSLEAVFPTGLFDMLELHDKQTGKIHNLKINPSYTFEAGTNDRPGRFILQFVAGDFPDPHQAIPGSIYAYNQQIQIDLRLAEGIFTFELYDLSGRKIRHEVINGGTTTNILHYSKGLYIARILGNKGSLSRKIFLY
ncbi:MAG: DUF2341 domain-containing protein [Bacteroidales bacterium]|nr:DUF2341 domain-containing protein [Bacteroidales bacterium]